MNERNLSQRLATSIVDALRARGHIAVTLGGAAALARELEDRLAEDIESVAARIDPLRGVDAEVTMTFTDDGAADEQVEELLGALARALVSSDHVEDVFAEEPVLRRELLRTLRDGLIGAPRDLGIGDEGPARLRLDTLGYLASMVARRAPVRALRAALDRAAQSVGCKLNAFDPETREATFSLSEATFSITVADPEARLDLEQAVIDELADLVSANVVALPAVERRVDLAAAVPAAARALLRPRIDAAAARTIRQGGCQASWELDGDRALKVSITPLSDKDAADVGSRVAQLASEIEAMVGELGGESAKKAPAKKAAKKAAKKKAPAKKAAKKAPAKKVAKAPAKKAVKKAPAKKAAKAPAKKAAKKAAAKKSAAKKAAKRA